MTLVNLFHSQRYARKADASHTFSNVIGGAAVVRRGLIPRGPQTAAIQPLRCTDSIADTQTAHQAKT